MISTSRGSLLFTATTIAVPRNTGTMEGRCWLHVVSTSETRGTSEIVPRIVRFDNNDSIV